MTNVREALNLMTENEIRSLFHKIDTKGFGFAVGGEEAGASEQPLREAAKQDEFSVFHSAGVGDREILCASNDIGECFLIGNRHGAWGVPVEASDLTKIKKTFEFDGQEYTVGEMNGIECVWWAYDEAKMEAFLEAANA